MHLPAAKKRITLQKIIINNNNPQQLAAPPNPAPPAPPGPKSRAAMAGSTEDDPSHVRSDDGSASLPPMHPQSFTPLQSRRLAAPAFSASLCPSMDLIALGLGNARGGPLQPGPLGKAATVAAVPAAVSPTVAVHRTLSWQRLLTLGTADLASPPPADGASGPAEAAEAASDGAPRGATALCWGPGGRSFAVGLADGGVLVHDVERTAAAAAGAAAPVYSLPPAPDAALALAARPAGSDPDALGPAPLVPSDSVNLGGGAGLAGPRGGAAATDPSDGKPSITTRSMSAARRLRSGKRGVGPLPPASAKAGAARGQSGLAGWRRAAVTGLAWARVSPRPTSWDVTEEEEEVEDAWRYRSRYVDRSSAFLPPCTYSPAIGPSSFDDENNAPMHAQYQGANVSIDGEEADEEALDRMARPTCKSPLSVLCVTTCSNGTSLYLHGRYRVVTVPPPPSVPVNVRCEAVCSADLGTILVSYEPPLPAYTNRNQAASPSDASSASIVSLYTIPHLHRYRYELQTISSLYCSISAHFREMKRGLRDAASSWTGAVRQLDVKFDGLVKMLRNYAAAPSLAVEGSTVVEKGNAVRLALRQYIISARSHRTSSAAAALDQFFSAPLMNDQLLQRMIRAVEAAASNAEEQIRRCVLAPSRSLIWDSSELRGVAGAMHSASAWIDESSDACPLVGPTQANQLFGAIQELHLCVEACLADIIEARCRLRDLLGWIRSTSSQVKARGTAPDSALREHARKRRVDDDIVSRVAEFLAGDAPASSLSVSSLNHERRNLTECVLGVVISDSLLLEQKEPFATGQGSIQSALGAAIKSADTFFEEPRWALTNSVLRTDITFLSKSADSLGKPCVAVHKRIGKGSGRDDPGDAEGYFDPVLPLAESIASSGIRSHRHWMLIARDRPNMIQGRAAIQVVAFPSTSVPMSDDGGMYAHSDEVRSLPSFYLTTFILLPEGSNTLDVKFYGDDGTSSLSASPAGKVEESRQALGVLIERSSRREDASVDYLGGSQVSEELLICPYDELAFKEFRIPPGTGQVNISDDIPDNDYISRISVEDGDDFPCNIAAFKSECIQIGLVHYFNFQPTLFLCLLLFHPNPFLYCSMNRTNHSSLSQCFL